MFNAYQLFKNNIEDAKKLTSVFEFLDGTIAAPVDFSDILRSQIVYSVSAFDKLLHDLVRIGMFEMYVGSRHPTPKYFSEPISMKLYKELESATVPPKEYIFEQAIAQKLKTLSFQEPDKVAEGLSYIWSYPHKWQEIAKYLGSDIHSVKTRLKLIVDRRNTIVHEADIDAVTKTKYTISVSESCDVVEFLERCGEAIYSLVN